MKVNMVDRNCVTESGVVHCVLTSDNISTVTTHCLSHFWWKPIGQPTIRSHGISAQYVQPTYQKVTCLECLGRMS